MEFEVFTLCDYAQDFGGKMVIVGTFDTIFAHQFPAIHATCSIASRIRFKQSELGQHKMKIRIVDANKNDINPPFEALMDVKSAPGTHNGVANFALTIGQLKFEREGLHTILLYLDDKEVRSLPLTIQKMNVA